MNKNPPPIYFYIPGNWRCGDIPERIEDYWPWRVKMSEKYRFLGNFDWTLQTYLYLKKRQFPCQLTRAYPSKGIIVAHEGFLEGIPRPNCSQLVVCIKADRNPLPKAQIHVVQNPKDKVERFHTQLVKSFFINHWIQTGLIPRSQKRGAEFVNVGYFGCDIELSEEFKTNSWKKLLKSHGYNWIMATTSETWTDYSDIDVLVAIRKCNSKGSEFNHKPASKLYNAWNCGIPVLLGVESAYRAERRNEFDYIEVRAPREVIKALNRLRKDKALRDMMVENGNFRTDGLSNEMIAKKWEIFFKEIASPAYHIWCGSKWFRRQFIILNNIKKHTYSIKRVFAKLK